MPQVVPCHNNDALTSGKSSQGNNRVNPAKSMQIPANHYRQSNDPDDMNVNGIVWLDSHSRRTPEGTVHDRNPFEGSG